MIQSFIEITLHNASIKNKIPTLITSYLILTHATLYNSNVTLTTRFDTSVNLN